MSITNKVQLVIILICLGLLSAAEDSQSQSKFSEHKSGFKKPSTKTCVSSYSMTCLKLDIVTLVDQLSTNDYYSILPGVAVVRENGSRNANTADTVSDLAKDFPNDPEARFNAFFMKKLRGYFDTHSIKLNFRDTKAVFTPRGRKGGGYGALILAAAMMKGVVMAVAMGGLAAVAGKALMTSMMALMMSAIIGLKSSDGGKQTTTYDVITKPIGHGHSGYGRSFEMPLALGLQPEYRP